LKKKKKESGCEVEKREKNPIGTKENEEGKTSRLPWRSKEERRSRGKVAPPKSITRLKIKGERQRNKTLEGQSTGKRTPNTPPNQKTKQGPKQGRILPQKKPKQSIQNAGAQ